MVNIEELREFCLALKGVKEDIKWGHDLCFLIGEKMFCVTGLSGESGISIKVDDDKFDDYCAMEGVIPAPYLARYKWIYIQDTKAFKKKELQEMIRRSYELILAKLPAAKRKALQ